MKRLIILSGVYLAVIVGTSLSAHAGKVNYPHDRHMKFSIDQSLLNWIKANISEETQLPYSFQIAESSKKSVYKNMGEVNSPDSVIERVIVEEGLIVYDGAVGQIVLSMLGGQDNLAHAMVPIETYWKGQVGELYNIRAGYPIQPFIYDPNDPEKVTSDLSQKGNRGFIFRIINANGKYNSVDPLDGKSYLEGFPTWPNIHWEDWKPVAGENAWVTMAALHIYHKKYYDPVSKKYNHNKAAVELLLAKELARAAQILQADNGGVRMAPLGTYRNPKDFVNNDIQQGEWWYHQISSENNISWYAAFRMLYEITQEEIYKSAMDRIEEYFISVWNGDDEYFYQGTNFSSGQWNINDDHFALDVQTWGILTFGPKQIDEWFGEGAAYRIWEKSKILSGSRDQKGNLLGVGYTIENDRISVEWTAGAIMAAQVLANYYFNTYPEWSDQLNNDAQAMRAGVERLRRELNAEQAAYSYSSKRGWIPFGWNSHVPEVLSLASTGWIIFVDTQFNPFYLIQDDSIIADAADGPGTQLSFNISAKK